MIHKLTIIALLALGACGQNVGQTLQAVGAGFSGGNNYAERDAIRRQNQLLEQQQFSLNALRYDAHRERLINRNVCLSRNFTRGVSC